MKDLLKPLPKSANIDLSDAGIADKVYHYHDGVDQPQIDPKLLLGFPIFNAVPTHKALDGTIILAITAPNTYYLYAMLEGNWVGVQLT